MRLIIGKLIITAVLHLSAPSTPIDTVGVKFPILPVVPTMQQVELPKVSTLSPVDVPKPTPVDTTVSGCGDNAYANYIYEHESGCSLYDPNPTSGACGIGQAWPCSKLEAICPNLDYACENSYFTGYANSRYGGWQGAYNWWRNHSWW